MSAPSPQTRGHDAARALEPPAASPPADVGQRGGPILLYDGACGLCARSVQWILEHEAAPPPGARPGGRRRAPGPIRFATIQGRVAAPYLRRHGLASPTGEYDTMVLLVDPDGPRERALVRSQAALAIGVAVGGPFRWAALVGRLVPRPLLDAAYRLVARNRLRFFGGADACRVPRAAERARFLDRG